MQNCTFVFIVSLACNSSTFSISSLPENKKQFTHKIASVKCSLVSSSNHRRRASSQSSLLLLPNSLGWARCLHRIPEVPRSGLIDGSIDSVRNVTCLACELCSGGGVCVCVHGCCPSNLVVVDYIMLSPRACCSPPPIGLFHYRNFSNIVLVLFALWCSTFGSSSSFHDSQSG